MKASISSFYQSSVWTLPRDTNILPNVQRKKRSVSLHLTLFRKHTVTCGTENFS